MNSSVSSCYVARNTPGGGREAAGQGPRWRHAKGWASVIRDRLAMRRFVGLSFFAVGAEVGACVALLCRPASPRGWNGSCWRVSCGSVAIPAGTWGLMRASVGRCRIGCGAGLTLYVWLG